MKKRKLTPKQKRFVSEYLKDLNGTQAAIRAGYSNSGPNRASEMGCQLLKKTQVKAEIEKRLAKWEEKTQITQERILKELEIVGFSDLEHYITIDPDTGAIQAKGFDEMPGNSRRALESISEDRVIKENADGTQIIINDKRKFKLHSKIEVLKMLGNYKGMWKDKNDQPGVTIIINAEPHPKDMGEIQNE